MGETILFLVIAIGAVAGTTVLLLLLVWLSMWSFGPYVLAYLLPAALMGPIVGLIVWRVRASQGRGSLGDAVRLVALTTIVLAVLCLMALGVIYLRYGR